MPQKHGMKPATLWIRPNAVEHQDHNSGVSDGITITNDGGIDFNTTIGDVIPSGDFTDCRDVITEYVEVCITRNTHQGEIISQAPSKFKQHVPNYTFIPNVGTVDVGGSIELNKPGYDSVTFTIEQKNKHRTVIVKFNVCTHLYSYDYGDWVTDETLVVQHTVNAPYQEIDKSDEYKEYAAEAVKGEVTTTKTLDNNTVLVNALNLPKDAQDYLNSQPQFQKEIAHLMEQLYNIENVAKTVSDDIYNNVTNQARQVIDKIQSIVLNSVIDRSQRNLAEVQEYIKTIVKSNFGLDDALRRQQSQFKPGISVVETPLLNTTQNLGLWLTQTGSNGYYDVWTNNKFPVEFYPDMSGQTQAKPSYSGIHIGSELTLGQATILGFTGLPKDVNTFVVTGIDWIQQWGANQYGGAWKVNVQLGW